MSLEVFDILLIEDDVEVRSMLVEVLGRRGYSVFAVSDGQRGIELAQQCRFRLVITDILMPNRDGYEVLAHFIRHAPSSRLLAISGGGAVGDPEALLHVAKRLGSAYVLAKPFGLPKFLTTVEQLLSDTPSGELS